MLNQVNPDLEQVGVLYQHPMEEMNQETQDTMVLVLDHALNVIIGETPLEAEIEVIIETPLEVEAWIEDIQTEAAAERERATMVLIEHAG